jgi:polysaccharide biosynthesis transport protein
MASSPQWPNKRNHRQPASRPPAALSTPPKPNFSKAPSEDRPAFERGLAIVRRNWLIMLICLVTVPLVTLIYSKLQTPEYTASTSLLFSPPEFQIGGTPETDPQREAATNLRLVQLEQIPARTAKALDKPGLTTGGVKEKIEVSPQGESDLIAIEATDESPEFSRVLANEYARQFIAFQRETDLSKITTAQGAVEQRLEELSPTELESAEGQELERRSRQLELIATLETGNAEVVQEATVPGSPSSPKTKRNVALGLFLGIVLAICLALLREQLDRRLRDLEDVEEMFDVPILGTIPESSAIDHSGPGSQLAPGGAEAEAFRMLRASLRYFNVDRQVSSILVTSSVSQDGKTTVAWNLALSEARAGDRVLYIESDLRRPSLAAQLGLTAEDGLSLVLTGNSSPEDAVQRIEDVDVLLAGPTPPNPAELIESERMAELLRWAEGEYDRVIIDTPPAAVVADAVALFSKVGGVVIVARLRKSPREAAEHLRDQLVNTGAPVLGLVINGVGTPTESSYYRPAANGGRWGRQKPRPARAERPLDGRAANSRRRS